MPSAVLAELVSVAEVAAAAAAAAAMVLVLVLVLVVVVVDRAGIEFVRKDIVDLAPIGARDDPQGGGMTKKP